PLPLLDRNLGLRRRRVQLALGVELRLLLGDSLRSLNVSARRSAIISPQSSLPARIVPLVIQPVAAYSAVATGAVHAGANNWIAAAAAEPPCRHCQTLRPGIFQRQAS